MDNETLIELSRLEASTARSAAEILQTFLRLARLYEAEDVAAIDALTACQLTVQASGRQVDIELSAAVGGAHKRLYYGTFERTDTLQ